MEKLYKRVDGVLYYHEAWAHGGVLVEHWGVVGERGKTRKTTLKETSGEHAIAEALRPDREDGFAPVSTNDHVRLLIEYKVDGFGAGTDLDKRHAVEDRLNETLGWRGLGICDGGSIGSGTMEVCCFVVDFEIAKRVIAADLATTKFADYTRIYDEDAAVSSTRQLTTTFSRRLSTLSKQHAASDYHETELDQGNCAPSACCLGTQRIGDRR